MVNFVFKYISTIAHHLLRTKGIVSEKLRTECCLLESIDGEISSRAVLRNRCAKNVVVFWVRVFCKHACPM